MTYKGHLKYIYLMQKKTEAYFHASKSFAYRFFQITLFSMTNYVVEGQIFFVFVLNYFILFVFFLEFIQSTVMIIIIVSLFCLL